MSNSIEKINYYGHEEVSRPGNVKDPAQDKVKMFVCEEHVTLWIKPNPNRVMMK